MWYRCTTEAFKEPEFSHYVVGPLKNGTKWWAPEHEPFLPVLHEKTQVATTTLKRPETERLTNTAEIIYPRLQGTSDIDIQ
jgi:hypothetical protein